MELYLFKHSSAVIAKGLKTTWKQYRSEKRTPLKKATEETWTLMEQMEIFNLPQADHNSTRWIRLPNEKKTGKRLEDTSSVLQSTLSIEIFSHGETDY